MEPRAATARNSSRATVIFFSVLTDTFSFWFTSSAVVFVTCRTSINSSSSTREPLRTQLYTKSTCITILGYQTWVEVRRSSKLASSCFIRRWLFITDSKSATRSASSSDFSIKITRPERMLDCKIERCDKV